MSGSGKSHKYDAFVSYRHSDVEIVQAVHRGLHAIGRRLGQRSALNVYRDETNLELHPDLWGRVVTAMGDSRWMIAFLSPEAVESQWCQREVRHWVETRGSAELLLVLVDGTLVWNDTAGSFDSEASTAALEILTEGGIFSGEPVFLDLSGEGEVDLASSRFRDKVTALAAPIHGVAREELDGIDLREQRRGRRLRRTAVAGLVALTAISIVAATFAMAQRRETEFQRAEAEAQRQEAEIQRDVAVNQAERAVARDLAGRAERLTDTDIGTARLYAAQAWTMEDNAQTRGGLFTAVTSSPQLLRQYHFGSSVSDAVMSADLSALVVTLATGEVIRRTSESPADTILGNIEESAIPASITTSRDGAVVAVQWWTEDYDYRISLFHDTKEIQLPDEARNLAISPDGLTAAYTLDKTPDGYQPANATDGLDITAGIHEVHLLRFADGDPTDNVIGELDRRPEVMRLGINGNLVTVTAPQHSTASTVPLLSSYTIEPFQKVSRANMGYAPLRRNTGVLSQNGEYYYNGSVVVPGTLDEPGSSLDNPAAGPVADGLPSGLGMQTQLAVSPGGDYVVGGIGGELTVIGVGSPETTITIPGSSKISSVSMPSNNAIVSADESTVSMWQIGSNDSIITERFVEGVEVACGAENCVPTKVYPNFDGTHLAFRGFNGWSLVDVNSGDAKPVGADHLATFLTWEDRDSFFFIDSWDGGTIWRVNTDGSTSDEFSVLHLPDGEVIEGAAWLPGEGELLVASREHLHRIDGKSGEVEEITASEVVMEVSSDGTRNITITDESGSDRYQVDYISFNTLSTSSSALSFAGDHEAVNGGGSLRGSYPTRLSSEVVVSPDGEYILTQPTEREFLVSSLTAGAPLRSFDAIALQGPASAGAFSGDGRLLFLLDNSPETQAVTRLRTIVLDPNVWMENVCSTVDRTLSIEEWETVTDLEPKELACS